MKTLAERFWGKVERGDSDSCWLWTAGKGHFGHGRVRYRRSDGTWTTTYAHRIAWELAHGEPEEGVCVCHHCDVPACCNPSHLFLGSRADNSLDMYHKGRGRAPEGGAGWREKCRKTAARGDENGSRTCPDRVARGERHGSRTHPERVRKGEQVGTAKLNVSQVLEIREAAKKVPRLSQKKIGEAFGISQAAVSSILSGKKWASVP